MIHEGEVINDLPQFIVGDYGAIITFHVINANDGAFDLTSNVVTFKAKSIIDGTTLFSTACTVSDATAGYCSLTIPESVLTTMGSYDSTLELFNDGSKLETISLGYLEIFDR